jgi:hypothetical protein
MDGSISVKSKKGEGSIFSMTVMLNGIRDELSDSYADDIAEYSDDSIGVAPFI